MITEEKEPLSKEDFLEIREELKTCIETILEKLNYVYAQQCTAGFEEATEKIYRDFFLAFILTIFEAESASMKRVFDIAVKVKTNQ